jgi:hypothetical protein
MPRMTPHQVQAAPLIPGYITNYDRHDGIFRAVRVEGLSDYQRIYGCRDEVTASTPRELEWLCLAETVKAEMVARAERAVDGA